MRLSIFLLYLIIFLTCCSSQEQHESKSVNAYFEKRDGNFRLTLYQDSTYLFEYPDFIFGPVSESGEYRLADQTLVLKRFEENRYPDFVGYGATYFTIWDNGNWRHNDTLEFSFTNLHDSSISVEFSINQNPVRHKADQTEKLKLPFHYLIQKGILSNDSAVYNLTVWFNDKIYISTDTIRKPAILHVQLNQYKGEKTVILYRKFQFLDSVIVMSDMDRKITGEDDKLRVKPK